MIGHSEYLKTFFENGKLLEGVYYFDPPLTNISEIDKLYNILKHIKGSEVIRYPLGYEGVGRSLLFFSVYNNHIEGWQNVDVIYNGSGEYWLQDLKSILRWYHEETSTIPILWNGRLLLEELIDTEKIFDQLNESEEDEWVYEYEWAYNFDHTLTKKEWDLFSTYLKYKHPGITWASGTDINKFVSYNMIQICIENTNRLVAFYSEDFYKVGEDNIKHIYDGEKILKDIINFDTDNIFDQLNESEEWFDEVISNTPNLPKPNNQRHLIFIGQNRTVTWLEDFFKILNQLGWKTSTYDAADFNDMSDFSRISNEAYLNLHPNRNKITFGFDIESFIDNYGENEFNETNKIYL